MNATPETGFMGFAAGARGQELASEGRQSMPIPDYQTMLLPVLQVVADGADHPVNEMRDRVAGRFKLTRAELAKKQKSGTTVFVNYVAWALAQLNMAQTIRLEKRGVYRISERGISILKGKPLSLTLRDLRYIRP